MLNIIEPLGIGLPDVDLYPTQGLLFDVVDCAEYEEWLSFWVLRYVAAMSTVLGLMRVERSKECAFRAVLWLRMIDRIDQQRETQDVGEQDEFLDGVQTRKTDNRVTVIPV